MIHLPHIRLKTTTSIKKNFDISEAVKDIEVPEESKRIGKQIMSSKKLSDDLGFDLMLEYENSIVYGFDFAFEGQRKIIPELNPVLIFYSNAVMFHRNLLVSKKILLENSPTYKNINKSTDPKVFQFFFQFATNCIINLQSSVESFANQQIPTDYEYSEDPSIFHKIDVVLPKLKDKKFKKESRKDNLKIRKLIELRNRIIHLTPTKDITNTKYKDIYRKIIKFEFTDVIKAVKNFINFYEPGLIEECPCGKEFYYEIEVKEKS